jgi:hypothetical protein
MAKVTITFEDVEDGMVNCVFESNPPFSEFKDMNAPYTPAQGLGYSAMEYLSKQLRKEKQNG